MSYRASSYQSPEKPNLTQSARNRHRLYSSLHVWNSEYARLIYLLTATVSLTPISGTVLPTTPAICRTCTINSSN
jgi:hypothetical protein